MKIWEDKDFYIEKHDSKLPWLKLFTKIEYKELSQIPKKQKLRMYEILDTIELIMLEYYKADKINLASFGNMLPRVHWHIIARFKKDPYFPKTTWEEPVREYELELPSFEIFKNELIKNLQKIPNRSKTKSISLFN